MTALRLMFCGLALGACADDPRPDSIHAPERAPETTDWGWDGASCPAGTRTTEGLAVFCVVGSQKDGPYFRTYAAGVAFPKQVDGQYDAGLASGRWRSWYPDEGLASIGDYSAGAESGTWSFYRADGTLDARGAYSAGARSGPWTGYHPNGAEAWVGSYVAGAPDGDWQRFFADGSVAEDARYAAGLLVARTTYTRSGVVLEDATFVDGVYDGPYERRHDSGELAERGTFDHGHKTGVWETFDPAGRPATRGAYVDDRESGRWQIWVDAVGGRAVRACSYVDGVLDGACAGTYDPGGQEESESAYDRGQLEGVFRQWWPNGQVFSEARWLDGTLNGRLRVHHEDGTLVLDAGYVRDVLDGDYADFYDDGAPKSAGRYEANSKTGMWTFWSTAGVQTTRNCAAEVCP